MVRSSTSAAQQIVSLHVHICLPSGSCCGHAVVLLFVRALLDGRGWLQRWDFYYNEIPRHGWCYGISSRPTFQSQVLHHRRELRLVVIRCWFVGCLSTWVHPEPQGLGGATFLGITVGYATGPALFKSWSYRWEYFFSLQGCAIGCHVDEALDATRRICIVTILMRVQISICGFSGLFVIPILCLDPKVSISDVPRKY